MTHPSSLDEKGKVESRSRVGLEAIRAAFEAARSRGRCALITYLTLGYPSPSESVKLVLALQAGGADIIELGVPFSDPVADGPTIQRASHAALRSGMTPRGCLELTGRVRREGVTVPLVLMGYYNPIYSYGLDDYARDCASAGVDGLIVPDLPVEEAGPLLQSCQARGLALILLVAPTSPEERVARIAAATQGFLYVVSRLGTTGVRPDSNAVCVGGAKARPEPSAEASPKARLEPDLEAQLILVRRHARTPVAVGFGVSSPGQVAALRSYADGVIVGSAIVGRAREGPGVVRDYVASLSEVGRTLQDRNTTVASRL